MVSGDQAPFSALSFPHPISLCKGYFFFGFIGTPCHLGILYLVFRSLIFYSVFYPSPFLHTRELTLWQGIGLRHHRGSWDIMMVLDFVRSLGIRICQFRVSLEFIEFVEFFGVVRGRDISSGLSLAKSGSSQSVYRSPPFSHTCGLSRSYLCSFLLLCFQ